MHSPTGAVDIEYYGMMYQAVHNRSGDNRVSEVIAEVFEVNVRRQQCRAFAVTAVNDLEEQGCVPGVLLFQTVKA